MENIIDYQNHSVPNPTHAKAFNELGTHYWKQFQLTQAIQYYRRALELNPQQLHAHANLGLVLTSRGEIDEAITHSRQALLLDPHCARAYSNLLLSLNYSNYEPSAIFQAHQQFDEQYALPLAQTICPHLHLSPSTSSKRRLKIGYVSGDFKKHAVTYFLAPILANHHREHFEIFCYYNDNLIDETTTSLQGYADHWIMCHTLTDEALTKRIREDQIDILVDLSGHTARNRLLVFAQKPAPVQVTFLGYPNTTGLTAIDYRITDGYVDAEGINDHFNSEQLIKLPSSFFSYQPFPNSPAVTQLPSLTQKRIIFSSFNNLAKLSPTILKIWAKLLEAIPQAQLLIKDRFLSDTEDRQFLTQRLAHCGISSDRLILEEYEPSPDYLKSYHRVDIALDTYPYNGGLTTCEALWMGIPVVTLTGTRQVSRLGLSILSTVGLSELVTTTPQEYLDCCVKLAKDKNYVQQLRQGMRERLTNSPLMDAEGFTRRLEEVYRGMWER